MHYNIQNLVILRSGAAYFHSWVSKSWRNPLTSASSGRWRQHIPLKCWYLCTIYNEITSHKPIILTHTMMRTPNSTFISNYLLQWNASYMHFSFRWSSMWIMQLEITESWMYINRKPKEMKTYINSLVIGSIIDSNNSLRNTRTHNRNPHDLRPKSHWSKAVVTFVSQSLSN